MYFKIQLFLMLEFCSTHHGWDGKASSKAVCKRPVPLACREWTWPGDNKTIAKAGSKVLLHVLLQLEVTEIVESTQI